MLELSTHHLTSVTELTNADISLILDTAAGFSSNNQDKRPLDGKILVNLFYEPSTRTNCSFQSAMMRLGGQVIDVSSETSSIQKGETLEDSIKVLSSYADAVVLRHPQKGAAARARAVSSVPLINAGDGTGEHPSQALLDVFTISRELGRLENLQITFVGDLKNGRTVHSLALLLARFNGISLNYVAPDGLEMPREIVHQITHVNKHVRQHAYLTLNDVKQTDVLYVTRVQKERFNNPAMYERVKDAFIITPQLMSMFKRDMIVMHPLPRVNEISTAVDSDPRAAYFRQASNGVFVRMAILYLLIRGVKDKRSLL